MKFVSDHILPFGRLLLVLYFLGNSGFTAVLYHCTMTEEMCGMSCCNGTNDCSAGICEDVDEPQPPVTDLMTVDQPCQTATVVGGYHTEPTVVEKQFNARRIINIDLLATSVFEDAIDYRVDLPAFHLVSAASNISPPSVEAYVLNASFLI